MRCFANIWFVALVVSGGCHRGIVAEGRGDSDDRRLFSAASLWNAPLPPHPAIDPRSDEWIALLGTDPSKNNFSINLRKWTIPVYEVTSATPRHRVRPHLLSAAEKREWATDRDRFGHGPGFDWVPIPEGATPDPEEDAHFAAVDWQRRLAWDMWGLRRLADGGWSSKTGMTYRLDGDGAFHLSDFPIRAGESVHFHGPSRAAGVPAIAGLLVYAEVKAGAVRHKLACATRFNAYQEFVPPAIWTDGFTRGGLPEGAVLQLDPALDLAPFGLLPGERAVAQALQRYGMVIVDNAGDSSLYAEGLWAQPGKSWDGLLRGSEGGINSIPVAHYRVLQVGAMQHGGDARTGR